MNNGKGISNFETEKSIEKIKNEGLVGVLLSNQINKSISIPKLMKKKHMKFQYII